MSPPAPRLPSPKAPFLVPLPRAPPGPPPRPTPHPTPPPPGPPYPTPSHPHFRRHEPAARCWSSCWRFGALQARCRWRWGPGGTGTEGRFGRAWPWERAIQTRFDDTPAFIQSTVTVGSIPRAWWDRLPGCGAALPVQGPSGFPGCRKDIQTGYLNRNMISFGILEI